MATLESVYKRAHTSKVSVFFFLILLMLSVTAGELVWTLRHNLRESLVVGGVALFFFCIWWFFFQWQSKVTWLCRLQMIFLGAGTLPNDYRLSDDAMPWDVAERTDAVVQMASQMVQKTQRDLQANRKALDKYVGSQASTQILKRPTTGLLGGDIEMLFVLFSKILGFNQMTSKLAPSETVDTLNSLYSAMAAAVETQGGEINKFIGDSVMAYFKRPDGDPSQAAERAVEAAMDMQKNFNFLTSENEVLKARGLELGLGVGIVSGHAILGNLGWRQRMEFTLIGDSVNLSARICAIAPAGEILVNEELAQMVGGGFRTETRPPVQLKGKSEKVTTYCILGRMETTHV